MALLVALGFGGCAQSPTPQLVSSHHPKEYFPSSIYGPASRRVIADGEPIPRGGGQYLVGKPYTVAGQTYYPSERKITQVGFASWYGDAFHGRLTANGEIYDRDGLTAAHPTMPLPSYARVTNLRNNYSMIVRVNDRGPYHSNRIMDVSRRVAEALDFARGGSAKIKVEYVGRASLAGSDDTKLLATLRTDGPARSWGLEGDRMVAEAAPVRVASIATDAPLPAERSERIVEDQRPAALATYRAARPHVATGERATERSKLPVRANEKRQGRESSARQLAKSTRRDNGREAHAHMAPFVAKASAPQPMARIEAAAHGRRNTAEARAFALREMAPGPVRHLASATFPSIPNHGLRRAAVAPALPPTRPVRLAASAPVHHLPAGSRLTRPRVD